MRSLPLLARPPAPSFGPAVAIPCLLAFTLLGVIGWARHQVISRADDMGPGSSVVPAEPAASTLAPFPEPVQRWAPAIDRWALEYGLPYNLVAVVMTLESCGASNVESSAGAVGLFQVMPFHFALGEDPNDPEINAQRGLAYLRRALDLAAGDSSLALAGYNGGHGVIARAPTEWPNETKRYVAWGTGILADLDAGRTASPALQAWLDAGGASLCRRASATSG